MFVQEEDFLGNYGNESFGLVGCNIKKYVGLEMLVVVFGFGVCFGIEIDVDVYEGDGDE